MRKILIVCNRTLNLGGIETSLVRLVNTLVQDGQNEISLVLHDTDGVLTEQLSEKVTISCVSALNIAGDFSKDVKHFNLPKIANGLYYRLKLRTAKHFYAKIKYWYRISAPYIPHLGEFDLAIAYSTDYSDLAIVQDKVTAKCKVAFVHSDPTQDKTSAQLNDKLLAKFDKIFCVSQDVQKLYGVAHARSAAKADVFYNLIDEKEVLKKSEAEPDLRFDNEYLNILTVGRISKEKGQDLIPEVLYKLKQTGKKVRWYLVGDGSMRSEIEMLIAKYRLEDDLILLGRKANPYPYFKMCNIYVQPSRSEAFGITVQEARILHKPIIATDFPGIREQLQNGKTGLIVPISSEGIFEGLRQLIEDANLLEHLSENLALLKNDNQGELQKLYCLIEECEYA